VHDHHRAALDAVLADARESDEFVGCILAGSVSRGWERPDSDLDVVLVATDEAYERRREDWDLHYWNEDACAHPDVYAEGKVVNRDFLREVAADGSEPARAAFVGASVEYGEDPEIADVLERIPVYPEAERPERVETFYSQTLAYRWFVAEAERHDDPYLAHHAAAQLSLFGGRLLLAHDRTLFPYHKWFRTVLEDADTPSGTVDRMDDLLAERTVEAAEAFVDPILEFADWEEPEEGWVARFLVDREWQWRRGEPALEEL